MPRTGLLFIGGLWVAGLVTGVILARAPGSIPLPTPAFLVPLAIALAADLLLGPAVRAGRIDPVTMNERAVGVFGAALVATALSALAGG